MIESKQITEYIAKSELLKSKAEKLIENDGLGLIHVQAGSKKYSTVAVDKNTEYMMYINLNNINNARCQCQTFSKYGKCEHVLAFMIKLKEKLDFEEEERKNIDFKVENQMKSILNISHNTKQIVNIRPKLFISEEASVYKLQLAIKFEGGREFLIKDVVKTITTIYNNNSLSIVKLMNLEAGEYELNSTSEHLVQLLMNTVEIYDSKIYNKAIDSIKISKNEVLQLIAIYIDSDLEINFTQQYIKTPPLNQVLNVNIQNEKVNFRFSEIKKYSELITNRLIQIGKTTFILNEEEAKIFKILKNLLEKKIQKLQLDGTYFAKIASGGIQQLEQVFEIEKSSEFLQPMIEEQLQTNILIERITNKNLGIMVLFKYGEYSFDINGDTKNANYVLIDRDIKAEKMIAELLNASQLDVIYQSDQQLGYLKTKSFKQNFDLLVRNLEKLQKVSNVVIEQGLEDNIKYIKNSDFSVSINQKDSDFFEMNINLDQFTPEEIKEVANAIELKEEYYVFQEKYYVPLTDNEIIEKFKFISLIDKSFSLEDGSYALHKLLPIKNICDTLFENVSVDEELQKQIDKFNNQKNDELIELENVSIRDYQHDGMQWLSMLTHFSFGGILADEMGLGKTLQVIGFLKKGNYDNILIVVPKALLYNWSREIQKYAPDLEFTIVDGTKQQRLELLAEKNKLVITSYNMLRLDINEYKDVFDVCIIDEAQQIKNPHAKITKAIKQIQANVHFALTGTPLENNLLDLWSIFDFCMPGYFKSASDFTNNYINQDNTKFLKKQIEPFMLRRRKVDVLSELPDKIETPIYCEMEKKQSLLYAKYANMYRKEIDELLSDSANNNSIHVLSILTRLRQLACHPGLFVDDYEETSGKVETLLEIVQENIDNGNKILVFSQFTTLLKIVQKHLSERNIGFSYLDGKVAANDRLDLVEDFNTSETPVFLISLKAGGVGLNLTSANTVIHLDPWWNPAVENQATDRAHRIGQKQVVQVNKLITKDTIEEKIYDLQNKKQIQTDDILSFESKLISKMSKDDILDLFT